METQQLWRALGELSAYVRLLERLEERCRPSLSRPCYWDVDDSSNFQSFKLTLYGCAALGLSAAVLNWGLGERSLQGLIQALAEGPLLGGGGGRPPGTAGSGNQRLLAGAGGGSHEPPGPGPEPPN